MNRHERRKSRHQAASAIDPMLLQGRLCLDAGRLSEAEQWFRRALAINPKHADSLHLLGIMAFRAGNHNMAIELIRQAIRQQKNIADYHNNLGLILKDAMKEQEDFEEAARCYRRALEFQPDNAAFHNNLANVLADQGDYPNAEVHYRRAIDLKPDYDAAHFNLGIALIKQNKHENAVSCFYRYLQLDPDDKLGASLLLAKAGSAPVPARASEAHMKHVYAVRANAWEQSHSLYKGHELVADIVNRLYTDSPKVDILDAGCGTGLVGTLIHNKARRLDGIDLSEAMLEKAKGKHVYENLYQGDMVKFMSDRPESYDVITSAATLIHFGDLTSVFNAAFIALRKNGLFVFTLFPHENENGFALAASVEMIQGGCYSHGTSYIRQVAKQNNFSVEILETQVHEIQKGAPVAGLLIALRRCA